MVINIRAAEAKMIIGLSLKVVFALILRQKVKEGWWFAFTPCLRELKVGCVKTGLR